jgi:hypothetical protein
LHLALTYSVTSLRPSRKADRGQARRSQDPQVPGGPPIPAGRSGSRVRSDLGVAAGAPVTMVSRPPDLNPNDLAMGLECGNGEPCRNGRLPSGARAPGAGAPGARCCPGAPGERAWPGRGLPGRRRHDGPARSGRWRQIYQNCGVLPARIRHRPGRPRPPGRIRPQAGHPRPAGGGSGRSPGAPGAGRRESSGPRPGASRARAGLGGAGADWPGAYRREVPCGDPTGRGGGGRDN